MKQIIKVFVSPAAALVLLLVFAVSMAWATFIENDFGTAVVWKIIYNSWWFEVVLILLCINFIFNIPRYKLLRKSKWQVLLFHIGLITIIIGAGITRYTSYNGIMRIREGEKSNILITGDTYLKMNVHVQSASQYIQEKVSFTGVGKESYSVETELGVTPVKVKLKQYIPDGQAHLEKAENGESIIELTIAYNKGRQTLFLKKGEQKKYDSISIGFESKDSTTIQFFEKDGHIHFSTQQVSDFFIMANQSTGTLQTNKEYELNRSTLYRVGEFSFVYMNHEPSGQIDYKSHAEKEKDNDELVDDVVLFDVIVENESITVPVLYSEGHIPQETTFQLRNISGKLGDITGNISYGSKALKIPFEVQLNDFQLERYPGSTSPSSYASEVSVIDGAETIPYRIYMNHVLDHKGYRFFQASYDTDERGTVLSVNHDAWGTLITYLGYLLMGIGMFFTLFSKNARFGRVYEKLQKLKSNSLVLIMLLGGAFAVSAQTVANDSLPDIEKKLIFDEVHCHHFGRILVQDLDGRIKPMNTLASEFLRKLSGRFNYKLHTPKGKTFTLNADQVFLGLHSMPQIWQNLPLIKIDQQKGGKWLENLHPNSENLVSFVSFLGPEGEYILAEEVQRINQKKPFERTEGEKEIIKIDERFNIVFNVFEGNYFKVFPNNLDMNNTWFSYNHHFKDFTDENGHFAKNIALGYLYDVSHHHWKEADEKLHYISLYQLEIGKDVAPSETLVDFEILYNTLNLNFWLFQAFFLIGGLLLLLAIVQLFSTQKWIKISNTVLIYLCFIGFLVFAFNIILRWYVAQHAPWSNGYEMLVFVSWCILLCGFLAYKKSDFALPLATLFTGCLLLVSYLDWLNPEITPLMPVLKSYWLKIHVAVIISSYAPLALACVVSMMALLLYLFTNNRNHNKLEIKIKELTYLAELAMTIGLFLLAIGTFLGGVWANESWGRYWAWDPKETWALISVIVYSIVLHFHLVPQIKGYLMLNVASMLAFWSIIMTSFGVNYYLSGLHSYAAGDPMPIPSVIYYILVFMVLLVVAVVIKKYALPRLNFNVVS